MSDYTPTPAQLQALLQYAGKRLGMTPEQLIHTVQTGGIASLENHMSASDSKKFHHLVGDNSKAEQLLRSPQIQKIMNDLLNKQR